MSKVTDLLDAIKNREGITTNYKLAKFLEIEEVRIGNYYRGQRIPGTYEITRIALALNMNPMDLIADIEAETEKNPKKREFWRNFHIPAASSLALVAALLCITPSSSDARTTAGEEHNSKLCALRQRMRELASRLFGTPKTAASSAS